MPFFEPTQQTPKQIEARSSVRAKGRKHYIIYTGILGFGIPMFALTTLLNWYERYGWHTPPLRYLCFHIILGLVLWPIAGYFFAARMWKRHIEETSA